MKAFFAILFFYSFFLAANGNFLGLSANIYQDLPKTYIINNFLIGFQKGLHSSAHNYSFSDFCHNVSIDNNVEVFIENAVKRFFTCRNFEEVNKTIHIVAKSFKTLLGMSLKGCEINLNEAESNEKPLEALKKIVKNLKEIGKIEGSLEQKIGEIGEVLGMAWKSIGKADNIFENINF